MIHDSIPFSALLPPQPDGVMETQSIQIATSASELTITNVYIPPQSSCPQDYKASIAHLITPQGDKLVLGDLNAHDALWSSSYADTRGATLAVSYTHLTLPTKRIV